jgi:hypothetical protein
MAEHPPSFQFEDVPLDEARRMGRGPRMEPMLYDTLRKKIESLADQATRVHLGPEITQQRMRNYILHIARELGVPVTIRRVPGGLLFWRSSEEDMQQAQEGPPTASRPRSDAHRPAPEDARASNSGHDQRWQARSSV